MNAPLAAARPRLRTGVRLGRALRDGDATVHYLKDPSTSDYFRVGPREFFLIERLDGGHTLADITDEYGRVFHRQLLDAHWHQLLGLLGRRELLAGPLATPRLPPSIPAAPRRRWLRRTVPLVNPDRLLSVLAGRLTILFRPAFLVPALLLALATEVFVATHALALWHAIQANRGPGVYLPAAMLGWTGVALHELAHGLAGKRFGADVPEIGILWSFPLLAPYCRVDDVVVFRHRRPAVCTALAGVFAGLLALVPFVGLWWLAGPGSAGRGVAASVLLFGSVSAGLNLLPVLNLDGYLALNHALGEVDLRRSSLRYLRRRLTGTGTYSRRDHWVYGGYGLTSILLAAGVGTVAFWWLVT